jgi:hypothetical protein
MTDRKILYKTIDSNKPGLTVREAMGKNGRIFVAGRYSRAQIAEIVETAARKLLP